MRAIDEFTVDFDIDAHAETTMTASSHKYQVLARISESTGFAAGVVVTLRAVFSAAWDQGARQRHSAP